MPLQAVCHETASGKRPSTLPLHRCSSRWGCWGRCRWGIPRISSSVACFSSTMHHASSQKGLRSGWQSGASEPHLLTRRCSNRRKFCSPSAPIAYATFGIFCEEAGAMVAAGKSIDCANVIRSTISSTKSAQAQEVFQCYHSTYFHPNA